MTSSLNQLFQGMFSPGSNPSQQPAGPNAPKSQGFNRNDPATSEMHQHKLEEIKEKQKAQASAQRGFGGGMFDFFGSGARPAKPKKDFSSQMTYMESYRGKGVIMTGGTGGIGSKVLKRLVKAGARVVVLARDPSKVEVKHAHREQVVPMPLQLTQPYQIEKKFRDALKALGGQLDHLILCHGFIKSEMIQDATMPDWDSTMNVNVRASFQLLSLAVPFLKLTKGNAVLMSSTAGEKPWAGHTIFSTSMAMINMLVKSTALETAYFGVRVNAVAPGITHTTARCQKNSENQAKEESKNNQYMEEARKDIPLGEQVNQPSDVAKSILWLGSDEASFITGEIMTIDGAHSLTMNNYQDYKLKPENLP